MKDGIIKLKKINQNEIELAYSIIKERYNYLINRGIHQYPFPYPPMKDYISMQKEGSCFGLYIKKDLAGIINLSINKKDTGWNINDVNYVCISSLFVNCKYKNQNIGHKILDNIIEYMLGFNITKFYLDCNIDSNFLEKYYTKYGFTKLKDKHFKFNTFEFNASLMYLNMTDHITKTWN